MQTNHPQAESLIYTLGIVGFLIGVGKLLQSEERVTARKLLGHGIVSGGLGGAAGLILVPLPEAPIPVIVGAACALASMGTMALTMVFQKYLDKK